MPYKLEPKTHTIYIDAPSVTEIADLVYPFPADKVKPKFLKMGQERGTCVHKQIEMYIKFGSKIGCTCEKKVKTHVEQGKWLCDWWDDNEYELKGDNNYRLFNEYIMYSNNLFKKDYELTGISDCILWTAGDDDEMPQPTIYFIDWKTTKEIHPEKEAMQLELYKELFKADWFDSTPNDWDDYDIKYMIVNSNKKTSYELTPEQMEQGKQDALKGLQLYKEKRDKDLWMN